MSVFLFKELHLTLTHTQFLSVYTLYTVLTCSVFICLMKCSSSSCIWHYVYTASLSIHSINLKCVHLAHEISHLKGKLVLNVVILNSFDLKLFAFQLKHCVMFHFWKVHSNWLCDFHIWPTYTSHLTKICINACDALKKQYKISVWLKYHIMCVFHLN